LGGFFHYQNDHSEVPLYIGGWQGELDAVQIVSTHWHAMGLAQYFDQLAFGEFKNGAYVQDHGVTK
jgi:hypothetical protein